MKHSEQITLVYIGGEDKRIQKNSNDKKPQEITKKYRKLQHQTYEATTTNRKQEVIKMGNLLRVGVSSRAQKRQHHWLIPTIDHNQHLHEILHSKLQSHIYCIYNCQPYALGVNDVTVPTMNSIMRS